MVNFRKFFNRDGKSKRTKRSSPVYEVEMIKSLEVMRKKEINFQQAFIEVFKRAPGGRDYREARKLGYEDEFLYKVSRRMVLRK